MTAGQCAYCGLATPYGATACRAHRQLLDLDPAYSRETTGAPGRVRRAQRAGRAQRAVLLGSPDPASSPGQNSPHRDQSGEESVAVGAREEGA